MTAVGEHQDEPQSQQQYEQAVAFVEIQQVQRHNGIDQRAGEHSGSQPEEEGV